MNGNTAWPDARLLGALLSAVHAQLVAALWLSLGMIVGVAGIACLAFGWRRPALACGFAYSLTLCFLTNGHAQILGPAGCAVALLGFFRPQGRPPA